VVNVAPPLFDPGIERHELEGQAVGVHEHRTHSRRLLQVSEALPGTPTRIEAETAAARLERL
jgi:hypothetical protein